MLRLLIDENFNHRILRGLKRRIPHLDSMVVRDVGLEGAPDPVLLEWAAANTRTILTHDVKTMVPYARRSILLGQKISGVIMVPYQLQIGRAIDDLEILVECQEQADMHNYIEYLPL